MKKKDVNSHFGQRSAGNLLKKMKLLFAFFFAGLLGVSASTYSQQTKLSISLDEITVKEAFKQIEKSSEFVFFYNEDFIDVNRKVSLNAKDEKVESILNELLNGTGNTFKIYDRQIVILPSEMKELPRIIKSETNAEQKKELSGSVKDSKGLTLPGVSVVVKGTTTGTVTDVDGQFRLSVPADAKTLVFSFVGMKTQEVVVAGKSLIKIVMEEETVDLEEVVAVGYGVKKKRDVIGSITSINSNEIKTSSGNIVSSIQGLSSGVQISSQGGTPGAPLSIRIRGAHSINSGGDPLWIIDGMPIYSGGGLDQASGQGTQRQDPMSLISLSDMENIQILKDAAATSIYGSRGSNGVIIVTTKSGKGKSGKAIINVDYSGGISGLTKTPEDIGYTNTADWFALVDKARSNSSLTPFEPILVMNRPNFTTPITRAAALATNTDWFDKMLQTGHYHDINISSTKAFDKGSMFTSFSYRNDGGVLKNNNLDRLTGRINVNYEVAKDLTATIRLNFSHTANDRLKNARTGAFGGSGSTVGGFPTVSRSALPWFPIYDATNASGYWNPNAGTNPIATDDPALMIDKVKQYRALGGVSLEYKLPWVKGLSVTAEGAFDVIQNNYGTWASQYLNDVAGLYSGSSAYESSTMYNGLNYNFYASYNNTFGIHNVTATAGTESSRSNSYTNNMQANGLIGSYHQLGMTQANRTLMQGYLDPNEDYLRSYFGRADYKLKDRYLAGISIRQDGSSKWGADYRWGVFTAYSLGWIVSEENFLKGISFINQLKLRGSVGQTGNNKVPNSLNVTRYENSFSPYAYGTLTVGTALVNVGTPGITWETTSSYDGGIDFTLLNNRLSGSIAYYIQNVTGLILAAQVAPSTGVVGGGSSVIWGNLGEIQNKGFEFSLSSKNVSTSSFTWTTDVNLTLSKDKVVALTADMEKRGQGIILGDLDYGGAQVIYRKGGEASTFYYPEFAGVDPVHGVDMIYEIDYDKFMETGETIHTGNLIPATTANLDKNKMILKGKTSAPKYFGGLNNTFTFKGFDLGISFIFSGGNYIFDKDEWTSTGVGVGNHVIRQDLVNNSWTSSNTNAKYPELRWEGLYDWDMNAAGEWKKPVNAAGEEVNGTVDYSNDQTSSTRYMYKGDYIRLKNLELGYNLSKAVVKKLNIQGLRVYVSGTNLLTWTKYPGYDPEIALNGGGNVDSAFLPSLKTFNFGLQLKF